MAEDCEELFQRARAKPAGLRFDEICKLAECFGFVFTRQSGTSHRIYKRPGFLGLMNFQEADGGMAVAYQVRQLVRAIDDLKSKGEVD